MRHSLALAENVVVAVRRAAGAEPALPLPCYQTEGAAGADVWASFPPDQRDGLTLAPWGMARSGRGTGAPYCRGSGLGLGGFG
ncbi:MAG: hypothetical protein GDA40_02440 [Rhodobacteraceae bacterium]|nr:hypothetical protein [Paracoccaceae bacterium]